jgi:hypothetical protein
VTAGVDDNLGVLRPEGEACQLRLDRPLGPVLGPDDVLPQHGRGPGQAVPLTSQLVSATMLSSAPSISHIVSGERSPVIVMAPKSSSSSQPVGRMTAWSVRSTPGSAKSAGSGPASSPSGNSCGK